jgi:hypothetical protein
MDSVPTIDIDIINSICGSFPLSDYRGKVCQFFNVRQTTGKDRSFNLEQR